MALELWLGGAALEDIGRVSRRRSKLDGAGMCPAVLALSSGAAPGVSGAALQEKASNWIPPKHPLVAVASTHKAIIANVRRIRPSRVTSHRAKSRRDSAYRVPRRGSPRVRFFASLYRYFEPMAGRDKIPSPTDVASLPLPDASGVSPTRRGTCRWGRFCAFEHAAGRPSPHAAISTRYFPSAF